MNSQANLTNSTVRSWGFEPSPYSSVIIYGVNILLGFPLNVYVMVLHLGRNRKVDPSSVFALNQASVEIFFILLSPFHCMCSINMNLCLVKPMGFLLGCGMTARASFQSLVCLERYIAVVHPITFLKCRPFRYRIVPSVMAWTIGLVSGIVCTITFPNLPYKVFIVMYIIFLVVTTFCCLSVLKKLKHPGPGNGDKKREDGAKKRAFNVIIFNLLAFFMQTLPVTFCFAMQDKLSMDDFRTATDLCLALTLFMSWVQVVFMLHRAGKLTFIKCT